MADIAEFAERAASQFTELQVGEGQWQLHLSGEAVEGFIKNAYYASQIQDEGRWPSVCLMAYPKDCERQYHFLFSEPQPPTAQEIAKLAHAVDRDSHICCICDQGRLMLGGIHVTMLNDRRDLGYGVPRLSTPLKLVIRGPGHIEVSSGGLALTYKAGEISEERLLQHSLITKRLIEVVEVEFREHTRGRIESLDRIFNDLAGSIAKLGHGGMILFAKQPKKSQFSSLRELTCTLMLQQLLFGYWEAVYRLRQNCGDLANLSEMEQRGNASPYLQRLSIATGMLEKGIGSIANLAGMDGAIVMTYDCKIAAFNAIIKRLETPENVRFEDERGQALRRDEVIKNKGSRHQSALQYVMALSDSFALVISQDAFVSAYHNAGKGAIVCERGMRVLD